MKQVFDPSTIAHMWANQTQESARNSQGNFYYHGKTIYSYGSHFPIAVIHSHKGKKAVVLFTTNSRSNTTAKHISLVRYACSHWETIYCISPELAANGEHATNINNFEQNAKYIAAFLYKAKKPEKYLQQIENEKKELMKYVGYFDLKPSAYKHLHYINIVTKDGAVVASEKERKEREKERAKAEKERLIQEKEFEKNDLVKLELWRKFKRPYQVESLPRFRILTNTFLRFNKNTQEVETSKDVKLPVKVAERYYKWLKHQLKKGGCDGNCNYKILDYDVATVDVQHVVVGCHDVTWSEIEALAKKLGWNK